jgi:hypothetical protein
MIDPDQSVVVLREKVAISNAPSVTSVKSEVGSQSNGRAYGASFLGLRFFLPAPFPVVAN